MTSTPLSGFPWKKDLEKANNPRYQSFPGIILILGMVCGCCLMPSAALADDFTSTPRRWGGESFIGTDPENGDSIMSITPPAPQPQQQPSIPYIVPQVNAGDWQNQPPKPPIVLPPGYVPPGGIYPPGSFPPGGSYPPGGMYPPPGGSFPPSGMYPPPIGPQPPSGMYPPGGGSYPPQGTFPAPGMSPAQRPNVPPQGTPGYPVPHPQIRQ